MPDKVRTSWALCMAAGALACILRQGEVELRREFPGTEVTAALVDGPSWQTCLSLCRNPMKVVIAPDNFKGSLSALEAINAIREGFAGCGNRLPPPCRWRGRRKCYAMSEASGMRRLTKNELDPLRAIPSAPRELILATSAKGARKIIVFRSVVPSQSPASFDIRGGSLYDALSGVTGRRRRKAS